MRRNLSQIPACVMAHQAAGWNGCFSFQSGPCQMLPAAAKLATSRRLPFHLMFQMGRIALESQMIIAMRTAGMMGLIAQNPGEPFRMIAEKQAAASESLHAAMRAASQGQSGNRVMAAALRPYGKRTRANSRRLSGAGKFRQK